MKKIISILALFIINIYAQNEDNIKFFYQTENSLDKNDKVFVKFNNYENIEIRQNALVMNAKISIRYKYLNKDKVYLDFNYLGARWLGYQYLFTIKDNHIFLSEVYDYQLENGGYMCKRDIKQISEGIFELYDNIKPECSKLIFFDAMKIIILDKQFLYKEPNENSKTKMYLIKNDTVEILEEQDEWVKILFHGKKDIEAWLPKNAVE